MAETWNPKDKYAPDGHDHDDRYSKVGHSHDGIGDLPAHNHDASYSLKDHNHDDDYAPYDHNHDVRYAQTSHNHDTVYSNLEHTHDYAPSDHNHDSTYSKLGHLHDDRYSQTSHDHDTVYSKLGHVHDYAASNHNHDDKYSLLGHNHDVRYRSTPYVVESGNNIMELKTLADKGIVNELASISWYRKWSDGTLEQGGWYWGKEVGGEADTIVSLEEPFIDDTYQVFYTARVNGIVGGSEYYHHTVYNKTTDSFHVQDNMLFNYLGLDWYARGTYDTTATS